MNAESPESAELARLHDELAAVRARELAAQERATKLARANAVLKETLQSLRRTDDVDALLGYTLRSIAEQLGVQSASAWLFDADLVAHLAWAFQDGAIVRGSESTHANANKPSQPNAWHREWLRGIEVAVPNVLPVINHPGMTPEQRAYLLGRGVRALISVPMVFDREPVGSFTLHLRSDDYPLAEDMELIQALANQASLALRLTRLAQDARTAAVAQQREQTARVRAETIARLAGSSRRTLERLAANPDLDAFLGHVTFAAAETFAATSGGVWRAEPDGRSRLVLMLEDGQVHAPTEADPMFELAGRSTELGLLPLRRGEIVVYDVAEAEPFVLGEPLRDYLVRRGIRTVVAVPMYLGDDFRGALSFRFTERRRLTADEAELAHALANQAVLAIELTRATQAARVAAVAEERNRLARDIHDTIAQGLAAIVRQLEGAASSGSPGTTMRHISVAAELARESLVEARRSIRALRPSALDGSTLEGALRDLVHKSARLCPAAIGLRTAGERKGVPSHAENELLRIASEALTNAMKHGGARAIDVELAFDGDSVRVLVRDDGVGFDTTRASRGVGLGSMRERAQRIGAAVTVASEPGSGTEVLAYWSPSGSTEGGG